ncbi:MAG: Na/Pi cotransporter family protein [Ruminococcaceae bacterium]|nr:Na/Pi cotransporter family protein [Oscillospiraceae bacterium]
MDVFDVLNLLGGLCLFLFGMHIMGAALERRAGGKLQSLLSKLTTNKFTGLLTGLGITAIIQSSSATTVMVVGFVNSGLMTLGQSIGVIMGANIGTTVTAWILSLAGIKGSNIFLQLLKPSSFTPVLAFIGVAYLMFSKNNKKKDTGTILLGFAVLMFGMQTMSDAVAGLKDVPAFAELFIKFQNPLIGVLVGAVVTGIIQSSSASVGILQALSTTGLVSYGAAIPIIMGQNIGTCVTALLSSIGTNRNARRAAVIHLTFNVIGTAICITAYLIAKEAFELAFLDKVANLSGIAFAHSAFNIICTIILFPFSKVLEKIAYLVIPVKENEDITVKIDERLMATPSLAIEQCYNVTCKMAEYTSEAVKTALDCVWHYTDLKFERVVELETKTDRYEDTIGTYLIKLSTLHLSDQYSAEVSLILKAIGDFERMTDHARNIVESALELYEKEIEFSTKARVGLENLFAAVDEIVDHTIKAFIDGDEEAASLVEPLEEVIDELRETLQKSQVERLQCGECYFEASFIYTDILTNLERVADHCENIAAYYLDINTKRVGVHKSVRKMKKEEPRYKEQHKVYAAKYLA